MCRRPVYVCLSACLSQVGVLSKRLNVGRQFLLHSDYFTKFAVSEDADSFRWNFVPKL